MCTISWFHRSNGYQLLCNRDEKLTRKSALEPRLAIRNGTRFLAPVDGDFGGTWIATNEFGVSVCLLNGIKDGSLPAQRSRGLLLLDLIGRTPAQAVREAVESADLSVYAPFTLATLEPGKPTLVV